MRLCKSLFVIGLFHYNNDLWFYLYCCEWQDSFLFMAKLTQLIYEPPFTYPFLSGWIVRLLYLSAVVKSAAIYMGVRINLIYEVYFSLIPSSRVVESCGSPMFSFLKRKLREFSTISIVIYILTMDIQFLHFIASMLSCLFNFYIFILYSYYYFPWKGFVDIRTPSLPPLSLQPI